MSNTTSKSNGTIVKILEQALFIGAVIGFFMANFISEQFLSIKHQLEFLVNEVLMVAFFAMVAKEIREARLPGGALQSLRKALLPLLATAGGMVVPIAFFLVLSLAFAPAVVRGWAVPTATDIAFSAAVAYMVLGRKHPAVTFLLTLAIADDVGGLVIMAIAYPKAGANLPAFGVILAFAMAISLIFKHWNRQHPLWYVGPMALSWTAFHLGGVHTALCAVPLVWCVPHRARDLGLFDPRESKGADTLSRLEHYLARPVQVILGLFGFINAGIPISGVGAGTSIVFVSLVAGKFLGVVAFTKAGQLFGLRMPDGMDNKSLLVISVAAGIGFTVALFVCTLAAPAGPLQDQLKMGALFSAFAAVLTVLLARGLRVRRIET